MKGTESHVVGHEQLPWVQGIFFATDPNRNIGGRYSMATSFGSAIPSGTTIYCLKLASVGGAI